MNYTMLYLKNYGESLPNLLLMTIENKLSSGVFYGYLSFEDDQNCSYGSVQKTSKLIKIQISKGLFTKFEF